MKYISKVPPYSQHYFEGTFKDADPVSWWTSGLSFRLWGQPMENSEHRWELKKLANLHFYTDN